LIPRERTLAGLEPAAPAGTLRTSDVVGIVVLGIVSAAYPVVALSR
jgi:hypothetical protein